MWTVRDLDLESTISFSTRVTRFDQTQHHDNKMEFDCENHEIQEVMDQEPRRPKLDPNGLQARPPGLPYGMAGPPQYPLTSCFIHGQVCGQYILFSPISLSVSNRIKNPLIKQLQNIRKDYFSHDLRIDSHNTFQEVLLLWELIIRDPMLLKLLWNEIQQNNENLILDVLILENFISKSKMNSYTSPLR